MSKKVLGLFCLVGSLALAGCGSKNGSGTSNHSQNDDGTCSDAFLGDYNGAIRQFNDLGAKLQIVIDSYTARGSVSAQERDTALTQAKSAQKTCSAFTANHVRNVSCTASDVTTGAAITARAETIYAKCDKLPEVITELNKL